MDNLDQIAYFIVYFFVAFVVLPCLAPRFSTYKEGLKVSFTIQITVLVLGAYVVAITWAIGHLL